MTTYNERSHFKTKNGTSFPALAPNEIFEIYRKLSDEFGITSSQVVESASYSLAMVIRYALGLSSLGGQVLAFVSDNLSGWTALATLRHLVNAGAAAQVVFVGIKGAGSEDLNRQLFPLEKMGVGFGVFDGSNIGEVTSLFAQSHNLICGLCGEAKLEPNLDSLIEAINEHQIPVHSVLAPLGIDLSLGQSTGNSLYSSSTLSLGCVFNGLNAASDYVGRHYICDVSISKELYGHFGVDLGFLFAEQPVIQISPA